MVLGVDIGSISTKGVVLDEDGAVVAAEYLWTQGNPIAAVQELIGKLKERLPGSDIRSAGTTGSARRLIGSMLGANVVKNEITAHAVGALSRYPDVRTILEIGGQDSKIILIDNGVVVDYAMNTLCAAGTGAFLSSQARRLGVPVEEIGDLALTSRNPAKIAARCTVFAESDMVHKAQIGHKKEDLLAGLCEAVVANYLSNVGKGKKIRPQILFQGGVSKNTGVVNAFERAVGSEVVVDDHSHLMGAIGAAILSKNADAAEPFDFGIVDAALETKGRDCGQCANHCEIIGFFRDKNLVDTWGNRCPNGLNVFDNLLRASRSG